MLHAFCGSDMAMTLAAHHVPPQPGHLENVERHMISGYHSLACMSDLIKPHADRNAIFTVKLTKMLSSSALSTAKSVFDITKEE